MGSSIFLMLKALSLLLPILVLLFADVSAQGKKPAKPVYDCKKYGNKFENPICCSVDKGTEGDPVPATGEGKWNCQPRSSNYVLHFYINLTT
jgi:hypothetical protein